MEGAADVFDAGKIAGLGEPGGLWKAEAEGAAGGIAGGMGLPRLIGGIGRRAAGIGLIWVDQASV